MAGCTVPVHRALAALRTRIAALAPLDIDAPGDHVARTRGDGARRAVEGLRLEEPKALSFSPSNTEGRMAARTEVRGHAAATTEATIDMREIPRRRRLQRALAQPEILEEFLVDPEGVARRFEVTLTEEELTIAQRLGHLVFEWDQICGDRRWVDAVDAPEQERARVRVSDSLAHTLEREVRNRIARDVFADFPEAIRRAADRFGPEALVRPDPAEEEAVPPSVRPLRRVIRAIARRVVAELDREFDSFVFHRALHTRATPVPSRMVVPRPEEEP